MRTLFLLIWFAVVVQQECAGIGVVRNGMTAFDAGTTQIGPYTDPNLYLREGIQYIYKRCGANTPIPLDLFIR